MEKLIISQIYFQNLGLTGEEMKVLQVIAGDRAPSNGTKQ
jgi:hypothetical protein